MVLIVGLTSGFGCGKSTVASAFIELGTEVLDLDKVVKKVSKIPELKKRIQKEFGTTNSEKLAEKVFSSPADLKKLNSIIHPKVFAELKETISNHRKSGKILVVEIPLLYETKSANLFDFVLVVDCSRKNQLERLLKRGFSKKDALKRIRAQLPLQEKLKKADLVIDNNGSIEGTAKQVILINNFLKALNK
ncbi:MAG: dephospho-CoA kinase [Candidatus Diapherotrites archaeon]|nr:dephospho-CoA kinase [Candidatus Diapherotrites archaeon]